MENELVQYFLVNKDISMGKGKVAAQVAHAATIYTYNILKNCNSSINYKRAREDFEQWYHSIQKKIILKAPLQLLEELEAKGYFSIRDKGYTQIPANSLTVVTLGVTTREAVNEIVNDLTLL